MIYLALLSNWILSEQTNIYSWSKYSSPLKASKEFRSMLDDTQLLCICFMQKKQKKAFT